MLEAGPIRFKENCGNGDEEQIVRHLDALSSTVLEEVGEERWKQRHKKRGLAPKKYELLKRPSETRVLSAELVDSVASDFVERCYLSSMTSIFDTYSPFPLLFPRSSWCRS
jgi:hypothetical protein